MNSSRSRRIPPVLPEPGRFKEFSGRSIEQQRQVGPSLSQSVRQLLVLLRISNTHVILRSAPSAPRDLTTACPLDAVDESIQNEAAISAAEMQAALILITDRLDMHSALSTLPPSIRHVIVSGVRDSGSEALTQSKDPCSLSGAGSLQGVLSSLHRATTPNCPVVVANRVTADRRMHTAG